MLSVIVDHGPLADHVLVPIVQHEAHMSSSGVRSRRAELVDAGLVEAVDTVKMPSGRNATVWGAA